MSEAESCDHLVLMYAGRVVADGTPEALEQHLENEVGHLIEVQTSNPSAALGLVTGAYPETMPYGSRIRMLSKILLQTKHTCGNC